MVTVILGWGRVDPSSIPTKLLQFAVVILSFFANVIGKYIGKQELLLDKSFAVSGGTDVESPAKSKMNNHETAPFPWFD